MLKGRNIKIKKTEKAAFSKDPLSPLKGKLDLIKFDYFLFLATIPVTTLSSLSPPCL